MSIQFKQPSAEQSIRDGCTEDEIIADAHANDCMRDALWRDYVKRQKQGPDPDTLKSGELNKAFSEMVARQRDPELKR